MTTLNRETYQPVAMLESRFVNGWLMLNKFGTTRPQWCEVKRQFHWVICSSSSFSHSDSTTDVIIWAIVIRPTTCHVITSYYYCYIITSIICDTVSFVIVKYWKSPYNRLWINTCFHVHNHCSFWLFICALGCNRVLCKACLAVFKTFTASKDCDKQKTDEKSTIDESSSIVFYWLCWHVCSVI